MKKSAKKSKEVMPDLVTAMMKLVERLEVLEKRTEQVFSRVSSLPTEMKQAFINLQRPEPAHHAPSVQHHANHPQQNQGGREKLLYEATCADCLKSCKVPFMPRENRPVYCPACFAIRKAGHAPKDLISNIVVPQHLRDIKSASGVPSKPVALAKSKKPAPKPAKKSAKKKKK